jgi:hypothetical protein
VTTSSMRYTFDKGRPAGVDEPFECRGRTFPSSVGLVDPSTTEQSH